MKKTRNYKTGIWSTVYEKPAPKKEIEVVEAPKKRRAKMKMTPTNEQEEQATNDLLEQRGE